MGLPLTVRVATFAALAAATVLLGAAPPAAGLHFYLLPGQRRCFTDDLPLNTLVSPCQLFCWAGFSAAAPAWT